MWNEIMQINAVQKLWPSAIFLRRGMDAMNAPCPQCGSFFLEKAVRLQVREYIHNDWHLTLDGLRRLVADVVSLFHGHVSVHQNMHVKQNSVSETACAQLVHFCDALYAHGNLAHFIQLILADALVGELL